MRPRARIGEIFQAGFWAPSTESCTCGAKYFPDSTTSLKRSWVIANTVGHLHPLREKLNLQSSRPLDGLIYPPRQVALRET
jgi:hypothetical protein